MSHSPAALHDTSQAYASRDYLGRVFAQRPTLMQVAESMIQDWLDEGFAGAGLRATATWIGVRTQAPGTYGQLTCLGNALIRRRMGAQEGSDSAGRYQLLLSSITRDLVPAPVGVSVDDIERMLDTLAPGLFEAFSARLVAFWNAPVADDPGLSRWGAVGKQLRACLLTAWQNPPLTSQEGSQLLGLGDGPQQLWGYLVDRQALGQPDALHIYQV